MIIGIDVMHPSPDSKNNAPSVARVVASINANCGQWPDSIRAQDREVEMMGDLRIMMRECLWLWKKNNKQNLSDSVLIYRDGVSESQCAEVVKTDFLATKAAIIAESGPVGKKGDVAMVVVGKRHHTSSSLLKKRKRNSDRGITGKIFGILHAGTNWFVRHGQAGTLRTVEFTASNLQELVSLSSHQTRPVLTLTT